MSVTTRNVNAEWIFDDIKKWFLLRCDDGIVIMLGKVLIF